MPPAAAAPSQTATAWRPRGRRRKLSSCRASAAAPQVCKGCRPCAHAAAAVAEWRATRSRWSVCRASAGCIAAGGAATAQPALRPPAPHASSPAYAASVPARLPLASPAALDALPAYSWLMPAHIRVAHPGPPTLSFQPCLSNPAVDYRKLATEMFGQAEGLDVRLLCCLLELLRLPAGPRAVLLVSCLAGRTCLAGRMGLMQVPGLPLCCWC